ncbi:MAG: FG-GAP-like repeat-containing protein [Fimbriiglobus sp.]
MPPRLAVEPLEVRLTPAVTVRFDYRFDTTGFFTTDVRAALDRAAAGVAPQLQDTLAAITPTATRSWTAVTANAATGDFVRVQNLTVAADELIVFVSAGKVTGAEVAVASTGGFEASGEQVWLDTIRGRGEPGALLPAPTDFAPWGGMIAFDAGTTWSFGPAAPAAGQTDFASVALHELVHVLGFGAAQSSFNRWVNGNRFTGPAATAAFGGPVPVEDGHIAAGTTFNGRPLLMDPTIEVGTVVGLSAVEFAMLDDIGWDVGTTPPPGPPTVPPVTSTQVGSSRFAVGIGPGPIGTAFVYPAAGATVMIAAPLGTSFAGGVRVATADVNGDGVPDTVLGTGPGIPTRVIVRDGSNGNTLLDVAPFEPTFTGGVNVAAGDLTGDGRPELVITPDEGGGPRVRVLDRTGAAVADFFGLDDPNFRGGARAAVGDVTGDGRPDLAVAAGFGGGPRVAVFDGRTVETGPRTRLVPDFVAFEPALRNGVFPAVGDLDADGKAELIVGAGPGGGPRVTAFSGAALVGGTPTAVANWFAGPDTNRGGVRVAARDRDADGRPDVITGAGENGDGFVRVYAGPDVIAGRFVPLEELTDPSWVRPGVFVG